MAEEQEKKEQQKTNETDESQDKGIPKERFDKLEAELKEKSEALQTAQTNIDILRAATAGQAGGVKPARQRDIIKESMKRHGLDPEDPKDLANQEQLHGILTDVISAYQGENDRVLFVAENPDYRELVGTREQIAQNLYAEPLRNAIKEDPTVLQEIAQSPRPWATAYKIAKRYKASKKQGGETKNEDDEALKEAIENANRPKSVNNTQGGQNLSEQGRFAEGNMSDEEVLAYAEQYGFQL